LISVGAAMLVFCLAIIVIFFLISRTPLSIMTAQLVGRFVEGIAITSAVLLLSLRLSDTVGQSTGNTLSGRGKVSETNGLSLGKKI